MEEEKGLSTIEEVRKRKMEPLNVDKDLEIYDSTLKSNVRIIIFGDGSQANLHINQLK